MNFVGHVAVVLRVEPMPSPELLAGAMLPDLCAIARVRLRERIEWPDDHAAWPLSRGIALHHASDAAFHASAWFNAGNRALRDALVDAGVDRGPARACAHAGLEMLLDGELVTHADVADATAAALDALLAGGSVHDAAVHLASPSDRVVWSERLDRIGRTLDPAAYRSPEGVALRLARMTQGRTRIELRGEHVDAVSRALTGFVPVVHRDSAGVVAEVVGAI